VLACKAFGSWCHPPPPPPTPHLAYPPGIYMYIAYMTTSGLQVTNLAVPPMQRISSVAARFVPSRGAQYVSAVAITYAHTVVVGVFGEHGVPH